MKTTIKAKVVIETDRYLHRYTEEATEKAREELTLHKIQEEISKGHYVIEWINSDLSKETEPTIIIKL